MATLTGSSTYEDAMASYLENASYEEDGSREKALAFITACRALRALRTTQAGRGAGGSNQSFSLEQIADEIDSARRWLAAHPSSTTVTARGADFSDYRDYPQPSRVYGTDTT